MPLTNANAIPVVITRPEMYDGELPIFGAALWLPLLLLPLPPLLPPTLPVPVGAEVTVPVPCAPASLIKTEQVPVGEAADLSVAEPLKEQAEARTEAGWAR